MRLSVLQRALLVVAALVVTALVMLARERLRSERRCQMTATVIVDCREPRR